MAVITQHRPMATQRVAWLLAGLAALLVVLPSLLVIPQVVGGMVRGDEGRDWLNYAEAGRRIVRGDNPYAWNLPYAFHYSPLTAYAFAAVAPFGITAWRLVELASLALLPRPRLMVPAALLTAPLWFDLYEGNTMTLVFVAGANALAGRSWGMGVFLALTVLMPRPLMLPLAAVMLWRHPEWRTGAVVIVAIHTALVLATGWMDAWVAALLASGKDVGSVVDIGPGRLLGAWWLVVALPLASIALWRGWVGMASLLASPYWLRYYLILLLWDLLRLPAFKRPLPGPDEAATPSGARRSLRRAQTSSATVPEGR